MKDQEIDIIKILQEIAENEHENYKEFRERLTEYCMNTKNAVFGLFRILNGMKQELSECLNGTVKVNVDRAVIIKVLKAIKIEIKIIKCRMKHPEIFDNICIKPLKPAGVWTHDKIDLIELIFVIKMSVNNGNVSIKALQECFEYIFQIKLGNIYDRFGEINERKGDKARYLESLIRYLHQILDKLK